LILFFFFVSSSLKGAGFPLERDGFALGRDDSALEGAGFAPEGDGSASGGAGFASEGGGFTPGATDFDFAFFEGGAALFFFGKSPLIFCINFSNIWDPLPVFSKFG
jgi:hypothetical protein